MKYKFVYISKEELNKRQLTSNSDINILADELAKKDHTAIFLSPSNNNNLLLIYLCDFIFINTADLGLSESKYDISLGKMLGKPTYSLDLNEYMNVAYQANDNMAVSNSAIKEFKSVAELVSKGVLQDSKLPLMESLDTILISLINPSLLKDNYIISLSSQYEEIFNKLKPLWPNSNYLNELKPVNLDSAMEVKDSSLSSLNGRNLSYSILQNSFPAEIKGINCNKLTDDNISLLKDLLYKHKLIIIRNQNLNSEEQIKFTSLFGKPDIAWDNRNRSGNNPEIQIISNQSGGNFLYRAKKMSTVRFWHADTSFLAEPTRYTFLHAKVLPHIGGDTKFINTKKAYDGLSDDMKLLVADKKVRHSFNYLFGALLKERNLDRNEDIPDSVHPLTMDNGSEKSLYLSKLAVSEILGINQDESEKLLTQLYEHCKLEPYRYKHKWQTGDILIWDNLSTMHKGTFADPKDVRELHRTTTKCGSKYF